MSVGSLLPGLFRHKTARSDSCSFAYIDMYVQTVSALGHLKPRRGEQSCNDVSSLHSISQSVALACGFMSIDIQTPFACSLEQCTIDEIVRRVCIKENVQTEPVLCQVLRVDC